MRRFLRLIWQARLGDPGIMSRNPVTLRPATPRPATPRPVLLRPVTLRLLATAFPPAAALLIIAYFAYAAIAGPNGVLSYAEYARLLGQRRDELGVIDGQRATLRRRMDLLDPRRGADPDYVDELVRARTGQLREDEVILRTH